MTDDATPRDGPQRRPNADEVMKPVLVSVFVVLVVVGIAAAGAHYVGEPYNTSFLRHPIIVALHVVLGGVYLLLVPLQFVAGIRARRVGYHRGAGRVLVGVASIVGATALFMALVIPFSGRPEQIIVGFFAGFFLVALAKSVRHVRAGRVRLHREWMIRSVSVALSISTMRLIFIPSLILVGSPTDEQVRTLSIVSFTIALAMHALGAELWIRWTRGSVTPAAGVASAV